MIDVGADHNPELLRIIHSNGSFAVYVALSHCCGGKITPLLITGTLTKFQECLPFHELPTNFRDAITITRGLGIRYLLIDSLYVLQNSIDNWKREFMRMGLVYRISLVVTRRDGTLAAIPVGHVRTGISIGPVRGWETSPLSLLLLLLPKDLGTITVYYQMNRRINEYDIPSRDSQPTL